ncbi:YceI family protein [Chryseobacterium koreense]|uniref:YceI family protein n=1 Tax=Chryseobacterium koreense TaxID=232216 RepID=UPI0026F1834E|nr:YceI family protein [Chryseobacterium koreense]
MKKLFSILTALVFSVTVYGQLVLKSDPAHSRIQFEVIHLGINDITGNFDKANLTINADEKSFANSKLTFSVDVNSINTHIEARDNHLKSADFFEVAKYPTMDFVSTSLTKTANNYYTLNGNLTMHGVTKPVSLTLVYRGSTVNAMNKKTTYGYQVSGTLNRSDFGIGPKFPIPMISDLIRIKGDFELTAE